MALKETDWDSYYQKPFKASSVTRKITGTILLNTLKKFIDIKNIKSVSELGGSNSAFYHDINNLLNPDEYYLIDKNILGLDKFKDRIQSSKTKLIQYDLLTDDQLDLKLDFCYSIGLIEHFDQEGTEKIIRKHFEMIKPAGYVLITFPTPTFLYRLTRRLAEFLGLWIFFDERPLQFIEVESVIKNLNYEILHKKIIWPIFLTQGLILVRKQHPGTSPS